MRRAFGAAVTAAFGIAGLLGTAGAARADGPPAAPSLGVDEVVVRVPSRRAPDVLLVGGPDDAPPTAPVETLPPVDVTAPRFATPGGYAPFGDPYGNAGLGGPPGSQSERVGPNHQPVWTTHRRFTTARAYVNAPWQVEFESWWRGKLRKDDTEEHRFQEEISIGLPYRFQVDLYWTITSDTGEETRYGDFWFEARHALAPWGCLPLNPTLYAEYKLLEDAPDVFEGKILFATEMGCRWQWALNFFAEQELGGERERELGLSTALGYTLLDPCLGIGGEIQIESASVEGARGDPEVEVLIGPSLQWRPTRRVHVDVAALFGVTDESPDAEIFVVVGFDVFSGTSAGGVSAPTVSRARWRFA